MTTDIQFSEVGGWGVVNLNRPKALNALTLDMVLAFHDQLQEWADASHIQAVLIEGEGDKAFCAGGDVMALLASVKNGDDNAWQFFHDEYMCNATIATYPKPYVALVDGIVMGGGVGVSVHGDFRVATDKTMFAMPETAIGLFPDVGGSYFLPRLHKGLGLYLGLTGARVRGYETVEAGVSTHYVTQDQLPALKENLLNIAFAGNASDAIKTVLDAAHSQGEATKVMPHLAEIEEIFGQAETLDDVFSNLANSDTDFAKETLDLLKTHSPSSMHVTFAAIKEGASKSITDVLRMELRLATRIVQLPDFSEGVTAKLLDKGRTPVWSPAEISQVSVADIQSMFDTLDDKEFKWSD
ncbi:MAG: enoyl-CoA hydratase/isomerase family protein [Methylocystaceae bacterium]|nr:enoyl-CoA hydratase/isomerase family protein [Methylocystaceae bacterium]